MTTTDPRTPVKAVFYFRTLDRWPGGNSDILTVKATVRLAAEPGIEAQFYRCFDGRHGQYPARRVVIDAGDALASFLDLTRTLAARGKQSLSFTVRATSDDEWDCDWAESEVLLYADDDGPETPDAAFLRLVRKVKQAGPSAPDPELERAFELARRLTGVGRVFQFTNTQDALSAAYRAQGEPQVLDPDYAHASAPSYLPFGTDQAFLNRQTKAGKQRSAAKAARASLRESMLVYRLDEAPELLTREIPPDASVRRCLFYAARYDSKIMDAMFKAIPEPTHERTDEAMEVSSRVSRIASMTRTFAQTLRPDQVPAGGSLFGGGYASGFHGGDAEEVERWLDAQGVTRVPLRPFLEQLIVLKLVDEDGAPLEQVDTFLGGPPARTEDSIGDGLFAFERDRDHVEFSVAPASADESDDVETWLELRASDLAPGVIHTVTVPVPRAPVKAGAKKGATAKGTAKRSGATKAASRSTPSTKRAGAKKAASKVTPAKGTTKKAAARKWASAKGTTKKAGAKKGASKATPAKGTTKTARVKKAASKATPAKATTKQAGAKKSGVKKAASKARPVKAASRKKPVKKTAR